MEMPLASTSSSSSRMETPSTGVSSTFSSRQLQSKKTAEGAFIVYILEELIFELLQT